MRDVVIVGSGPAGMSAAMALSGRADVLVIERLTPERHTRYHSICGEAVSDRMFGELGWRPSSVVSHADSISISTRGGASVSVPVSGNIVDRPSMLGEMRERCDAEFIRGSVSRVERADGGYRLSLCDGRTVVCRHLIGADGAHSVVRCDVFGLEATDRLPIVNCIVRGDAEPTLGFTVAGGYAGGYSWLFPSKPGTSSIGFPKGCGTPSDLEGLVSSDARDLPFGVVERVVDGDCMIVGDAACLANPLCYGGIGVALLSGKKAAEALLAGDPGRYAKWISRNRMFDRHFMDAHRTFCSWSDEDIEDAMMPFRGGYSLMRGFYAMLRRPKWANVYMSIFVAFRLGW